MKNTIYLFFAILALTSLYSCEEDPELFVSISPTAATISSPADGSSFVLSLETANDTLTIAWNNADFGFQASTTYTIEIDKKDNKFVAAQDLAVVGSPAREYKISLGDLNNILLGLGLPANDVSVVELRIRATISDDVSPAFSSTISLNVTPYQTSFPPIYMIGGAVGGWDPSLAVEMRSSEPYVYETIAYFTSGEAYRYFATPGWDADPQYNWTYFEGGTVDANLENAQDGDTNIRFIGTTGYYKMVVNTNTKVITMEAVDEPKMFLIGNGIVDAGWNTATAVQMTWVSNGIFKATTEFANEAFRFFAQQDWGPTSYNYPFFADGEVSSLLEDAGDGDNNFKFVGTEGIYTITVNLLDLTVTMEAQ
jgi:hypothetical protein